MKNSSHLCNIKIIISAFVVNTALVGIYTLLISRENAELPISARELRPSTMRPHTTLSGLNCTLEAGIMSVKTTEIWDSRVVKVMKQ